jgi:hypothetical protein
MMIRAHADTHSNSNKMWWQDPVCNLLPLCEFVTSVITCMSVYIGYGVC